jgi:hypothetical protein
MPRQSDVKANDASTTNQPSTTRLRQGMPAEALTPTRLSLARSKRSASSASAMVPSASRGKAPDVHAKTHAAAPWTRCRVALILVTKLVPQCAHTLPAQHCRASEALSLSPRARTLWSLTAATEQNHRPQASHMNSSASSKTASSTERSDHLATSSPCQDTSAAHGSRAARPAANSTSCVKSFRAFRYRARTRPKLQIVIRKRRSGASSGPPKGGVEGALTNKVFREHCRCLRNERPSKPMNV